MCTLLVATRVWADAPLLVAANRDERLDRPAEGPRLRQDGPVRVIAPRDIQAGGTWLGLNAHGVFSGITNRFGARPDPRRRSRGELVVRALGARTAELALEQLTDTRPEAYNPFHLLVADAVAAGLVWSDGTTLHSERLAPGVVVLTERSFGAAPSGRETLLRAAGAALAARGAPPDDAELTTLLATHAPDPFDAVCVHLDAMGYGTRSAAILRWSTPAVGRGPSLPHAARGCGPRVAVERMTAPWQ